MVHLCVSCTMFYSGGFYIRYKLQFISLKWELSAIEK